MTVDAAGGGRRRDRLATRRYRPASIAIRVLLPLVAIAVLVATFVQIPYYAITPGTSISVEPLISVPRSVTHAHRGSVSLTDVELVSLRAIEYPFYRLNGDDQIEPNAAVRGPSTAAAYNEEGVIDMQTARQAATVVALRMLGYHTDAIDNGVVVYGVEPSSPAARHLAVGDIITSVDGHKTASVDELTSALDPLRPGTAVAVAYRGLSGSKSHVARIALGEAYAGADGAPGCAVALPTGAKPLRRSGEPVGCLGFFPEQIYATSGAPFPVTIDSNGIVGPSAGLAFTLGLLEKLDAADLTGGRKIAATGTMSIDGAVGDVGGVAQKTVAVRRAGATVFFVPPQEYGVAMQHAGSTLTVLAVTTAQQAVHDLEQLGGRLVRATP